MFQNLKNQVPTTKENMYILPQDLSQTPTLYSGQENELGIIPQPQNILFANSRGWIHNHYADPDSAGLIFSAGDIITFADQINDTANLHLDYKNYMIGVVGDSSTQYVLMISDLQKFKLWASLNANEFMLTTYYTVNMLSVGFLPVSVVETEKRFLKIMQQAGVQLYKGSNDFKTWNALNLNQNGTVVTSTPPCN